MTNLTLEQLRAELVPVLARIDGLYVITEQLRKDVRMVRTAINDMARTDISAGEVEALTMSRNILDLGTELVAAIERSNKLGTLQREYGNAFRQFLDTL